MSIVLVCGTSGDFQSAYFVVSVARLAVPAPRVDFNPAFNGTPTNFLAPGLNDWFWGESQGSDAADWDENTFYAMGAIKKYTTNGHVYKSLKNGNQGHQPDLMDGWWTDYWNIQNFWVANQSTPQHTFGYVITTSPITSIAAWTFALSYYHSLNLGDNTRPGTRMQLFDVAIKFNYADGTVLYARPTTVSDTGSNTVGPYETTSAKISNPGPMAQFNVWRTCSMCYFPGQTLSNFQPDIPTGGFNRYIAGQPYTYTLEASGGTAPYLYSIVSGSLPNGLILNPETGVISGTATETGPLMVTFQVTDSLGETATAVCGLTSNGSYACGDCACVFNSTLEMIGDSIFTVPVTNIGTIYGDNSTLNMIGDSIFSITIRKNELLPVSGCMESADDLLYYRGYLGRI